MKTGLNLASLGGIHSSLLIGNSARMQKQACGPRKLYSYSLLMFYFLVAILLLSYFRSSCCLAFITYHCVLGALFLLS